MRTGGDYSLLPGSRVYVHNNSAPDSGSEYSELVTLTSGNVIPHLMTETSIPVWNTGLVARSTADSAVYSRVLSYAGARPSDRDSVDKRVILNVRKRTGQIINCVSPNGTTRCKKNAGGGDKSARDHLTHEPGGGHRSAARTSVYSIRTKTA